MSFSDVEFSQSEIDSLHIFKKITNPPEQFFIMSDEVLFDVIIKITGNLVW